MTYTIHAGHNRKATGAIAILNEVTENRKVVEACQRLSGGAFIDCTDDAGKTPNEVLRNLTAKMNSVGADYNLSIHLNAGGGTGCECIIYPGSKSRALAEKISANISSALGIRNRGVKERSTLYVLRRTSKPTIIVECAFVDSQNDAEKWDAEKVAHAIITACGFASAIKTGWQRNEVGWWYNDANGNYVTGWQHIGSYWYHFAPDGYMQTGWQHIGSYWYYFTSDGNMVTGWQLIDGKHYFFYPDGNMAADTTTPDGYRVNASGEWEQPKWETVQKWWYRHADGTYSTNSFEQINGKWYYFDEDGYMVTGWKEVDGKWYYFDESGAMLADTTTPDGYNVGADGAMIEG